MNLVHPELDCDKCLLALQRAAHMFEQASATETAVEIRKELERLASLTSTVLPSPEALDQEISDAQLECLFDIPSFLGAMVRVPASLYQNLVLAVLTRSRNRLGITSSRRSMTIR